MKTKAERAAYAREYRAVHSAKISARKRAWYRAHREIVLADRRARYAEDADVRQKAAKQRDTYRRTHRERVREVNRAAYRRNPEAQARRGREYRAKQKAKRFRALGFVDTERCGLCGELPGEKGLAVDHCHATGRIRGLLCSNCNTGLGLFRDDPALLRAAIEYLAPRLVVVK